MVQTNNSERELISRRNRALWRSLGNLGDSALEEEFKACCVALSKNTRTKRRFIESVNSANTTHALQTMMLT